ncbi:class I SAM-dependent methyltransferase [Legionella spiritensis]|uniref:SAM-dependent methyltransferase n=1 Tax=Legionella spiritensis TaxID=452 RepID=A0A0W0Z604_LEGSP|nr:class I SAM-dependent methyltransferase [Legionella spiritensis]KTD64571.1 SAM-dependent methyltransferase [Legionella spiritensis]SNV29659.1 SAM-dependent methyltransferase [Legionella spiritensis]
MNDRNWEHYYKITKQITSPRKTLLKAIEIFSNGNKASPAKLAIDLGCGSGTDAIELLKHGWSVLAIDYQPEAISTLLSLCPPSLENRLETKVMPFELLTSLPRSQLINASYSLPFLKADKFYLIWNMILNALHQGDIFSGTFFGINDGWNGSKNSDMTFFNHKDLSNFLMPFEVAFLEEEENDKADAMGNIKHWHKYFVVAKKR